MMALYETWIYETWFCNFCDEEVHRSQLRKHREKCPRKDP